MKKPEERKELYPKPVARLCLGEKALSAKQAKSLIGWEEETGKKKFGDDYLLKNTSGVKIRCANNDGNRPFTMSNTLGLQQEILRRRWNFNFENIIVGRTGIVRNGQHRLVGLILATELWHLDPGSYPLWSEEPSVETSIGFGVEDSDAVINTMDTCKPRTLTDVIYRSEFFQKESARDRKRLARVTEHGVRLLWDRTGVPGAYDIRRSHSESLDFLARHPKLLRCTKHIYEENGAENRIGRIVSPGYAAGLMYLFGSGTTDATDYAMQENPNEKGLSWDDWDKACDFFVLVAGDNERVKALRAKIAKMLEAEEGASQAERLALTVRAWTAYREHDKVTAEDLDLEYETDEEGWRTLVECPIAGGIDQGDASDAEFLDAIRDEQTRRAQEVKEQARERAEREASPTPEEIKDRAHKIRNGGSADDPPKKKKGRRKRSPDQLVGRLMWVADEEPWRGKVLEVSGKNAKLKVANGFQGAGNIQAALVSKLSKIQVKP